MAKRNYYDFPEDFEAVLFENGLMEDLFYLRDLEQRKLFVSDNITAFSVYPIVKHILQFNKEDSGIPKDERRPILLYMTSPGGEESAGFSLIDAIQNSETPVYTINLGTWYSMAFLIGLSGHKRFATQNAKFLLHDGSYFMCDSSTKVQDRMEFCKKGEERIKRYVLSHSKISEEEYDSKLRVEWFMFADEAKNNGVIDYIIGEDCGLDEIV